MVAPQEAANQLRALDVKEVSYLASKIVGAGVLLGFATKLGENAANRVFPLKPVVPVNETKDVKEETRIENSKETKPVNNKTSVENATTCNCELTPRKTHLRKLKDK